MTQSETPALVKIQLPDAHIVNGNEFPAAFKLESTPEFKRDPAKVAAFLKQQAEFGFFNEAVAKHGAVVIRDTGSTDPAILSQYIDAIGTGSGDETYIQNGSTAQRTVITNSLSTANEGPASTYIHQHNEFSRFKRHPTRLMFVCTKYEATTTGGETPIVHGAEFFNHLQARVPELVESLARRGLYYAQIWNNTSKTRTSWSDYFCFGRDIQSSDNLAIAKRKAEENVRANVSDEFEWLEGDNLLVHQKSQPIRVYENPFTGQRAPTMFTSIVAYYDQYRNLEANAPTAKLKYNDGEEINEEWLQEASDISMELSYRHAWQESDIALVDNYQVSHGRVGWAGGKREILVSMWDRPNKPEYAVYVP